MGMEWTGMEWTGMDPETRLKDTESAPKGLGRFGRPRRKHVRNSKLRRNCLRLFIPMAESAIHL